MKAAYKIALSLVFLTVLGLGIMWANGPVRADQSLIDSQIGFTEAGTAYGNSEPVDIRITIAKIINIILQFLGVIFIVLIIYAGFQYMTSGGNKDQTEKAVKLITNAVIGLVIILMAWAITRFAITQLGRSTNGAVVDYTTYR